MNDEAVLQVELAGADPLAAAAVFHQVHLPRAVALVAEGLRSIVLQFDHAEEKPHRWRREAVAALARAAVPARINGVAPASPQGCENALSATVAFLNANEGITGQLLIAGTLGGD